MRHLLRRRCDEGQVRAPHRRLFSRYPHNARYCRLVGFDELGNEDGFDTAVLELRLAQSGMSYCSANPIVFISPVGVISKQLENTNALQPLFKVSSSSRAQDGDDDLFDM